MFSGNKYTLKKTEWPSSCTWKWTDTDGTVHTDFGEMFPLTSKRDPIELKGNNYVFVMDYPLRQGEKVMVTLTHEEDGTSLTWTETKQGVKDIVLDGLWSDFSLPTMASLDARKTKMYKNDEKKFCIYFVQSLENQ
jgi:hypothetical protein